MQETILIVGGTSGLGRGLCELYCTLGSKVGVVGRRQALIDELEKQFPAQVTGFTYDISQNDCTKSITAFIQQLGGIDKLVLTASVVQANPAFNFTEEEQTLAVNVNGFAAVLNAGYHYFSKKGCGHIIAVTSIAAARATNKTLAYNASKAFQSLYTEGLRLKLLQENKNITVTEIIPGYVDTDMAKGDRLFWVAPLPKAIQQIKKAIDAKLSRVFVTKRWRLIYTLYKYLPKPVYTYLVNSKIKLQQKH
jgi:short-subunit dehydrogenase